MSIKKKLRRWFEQREIKHLSTKLEPSCSHWNDLKDHYYSHLKPIRTIELILRHHFEDHYGELVRVTGIETIIINNVLEITLTTVRPGLIIGFRGRDFNELKKKFEDVFHLDINLVIKEDRSFYFYEKDYF